MCYWCFASLLAWGVLSLIGIYWYPLRAYSAATICLAVAIGCGANWLRNRTLHCGITGPLFLLAGAAFLLSDMHIFPTSPSVVWSIVAVVAGLSFLLEWRYAARSQPCSGATQVKEPDKRSC
jgi:hypothetical protein